MITKEEIILLFKHSVENAKADDFLTHNFKKKGNVAIKYKNNIIALRKDLQYELKFGDIIVKIKKKDYKRLMKYYWEKYNSFNIVSKDELAFYEIYKNLIN